MLKRVQADAYLIARLALGLGRVLPHVPVRKALYQGTQLSVPLSGLRFLEFVPACFFSCFLKRTPKFKLNNGCLSLFRLFLYLVVSYCTFGIACYRCPLFTAVYKVFWLCYEMLLGEWISNYQSLLFIIIRQQLGQKVRKKRGYF